MWINRDKVSDGKESGTTHWNKQIVMFPSFCVVVLFGCVCFRTASGNSKQLIAPSHQEIQLSSIIDSFWSFKCQCSFVRRETWWLCPVLVVALRQVPIGRSVFDYWNGLLMFVFLLICSQGGRECLGKRPAGINIPEYVLCLCTLGKTRLDHPLYFG